MKYHKTKDGNKIKLHDLELSHLKNIINWIERKSKSGLIIRSGGGSCPDDFWYEEYVCYGDDAKKQLNFDDYIKELNSRNNA